MSGFPHILTKSLRDYEENFTDDKEAITSVGSELDHSVACGYRLLNLQITDY